MGVCHFKSLFKASPEVTIVEVIQVEQVFPSFVEEDDNEIPMAPISKGEVEGALQSMQKEKSLGPDG